MNPKFATSGIAAIFAIVLCALGCEIPEPPSDEAIYGLVLQRARRELGLQSVLLVHPLLAIWEPDRAGPDRRPTNFNAFDSTSAAGAVALDSTSLRLCKRTLAGPCEVRTGETSVILSNINPLGTNALAVLVIVTDGRGDRVFQTHYVARLKGSVTGWFVVAFEPLDAR